ncbi:MAG: UDP-N-acetylmuramate--L-alanine ligase [Peptostreptococcaceae bacterium]|nr:UDP-N-acetylmuramate--L-alanine ligase [Peptostreptococcaceae bacterium]
MNIHFIGIGGISMSGLASICLERGDIVSGSDNNDTAITKALERQGATIHLGHRAENINEDIDLVIYTAAIRHDNPELVRANELGIKILNRAIFLGQLMDRYPNAIAVSGTHGKTSTTSMLSTIYMYAGLDPTISVGGNLRQIGGNYHVGDGHYFITEACEYVDSFFSLNPKYAIILNIEHEHIDYFKDIDQVIRSFKNFAGHVPSDGKIIANGDDENVRKALDGSSNVIYFGFGDQNDCVISNVSVLSFGSSFDLTLHGKDLGSFTINVIGNFNILNATASILCAYANGLTVESIRQGILQYHGVGRRFEKKGQFSGAIVYDDYAHHPSEVKATLSAANKLEKNRLITIFQPHTFSRTFSLMDQFVESFDDTDILILTDVYPSREIDTGYVHSTDLFEKLHHRKDQVYYIGEKNDVIDFLRKNVQDNDIILTMGAGDIYKVSEYITSEK